MAVAFFSLNQGRPLQVASFDAGIIAHAVTMARVTRFHYKEDRSVHRNRLNGKIRWKARLLGIGFLFLLGVGVVVTDWQQAQASSSWMSRAEAQYPTIVGTPLDDCTLCHTSAPSLNSYGSAFANNSHSFTAIQNLDSDGDGFTNLAEINAHTFPGNRNSHPAASPNAGSTHRDIDQYTSPAQRHADQYTNARNHHINRHSCAADRDLSEYHSSPYGHDDAGSAHGDEHDDCSSGDLDTHPSPGDQNSADDHHANPPGRDPGCHTSASRHEKPDWQLAGR
jgi:hypothetical protein